MMWNTFTSTYWPYILLCFFMFFSLLKIGLDLWFVFQIKILYQIYVIKIFLPIHFNGYLLMCESFKFLWSLIYQVFFSCKIRVLYVLSKGCCLSRGHKDRLFFFPRNCITLFGFLWLMIHLELILVYGVRSRFKKSQEIRKKKCICVGLFVYQLPHFKL